MAAGSAVWTSQFVSRHPSPPPTSWTRPNTSGGASINGVYLLYRTLAAEAQSWWVTNTMEVVSGDTYSLAIPALAAGTALTSLPASAVFWMILAGVALTTLSCATLPELRAARSRSHRLPRDSNIVTSAACSRSGRIGPG